MPESSVYSIDTVDLQIGSTLPFDLRDANGNIVHKSGLPVTQRLLDRLLALGIKSVTVKGQNNGPVSPLETLVSSYDPEKFACVSRLLDQTTEQMGSIFRNLVDSVPVETEEIRESVSAYVEQISEDASSVFGVLAAQGKRSDVELWRYLTERSVRMSYFSVANAIGLGYSEVDAMKVGTLALLADISLFAHPEWFDDNHRIRSSIYLTEEYQNHSVESATTVKQSMDFDDDFVESLSQLQEMGDGSGCPYGLKGEFISEESKIVSLVDTYLSMTEDGIDGRVYLESDVLAFLMHQACLGKFDKRAVRGFIKTFSLYPVGVQVELDDNSIAVVFRTNPNNPFQPIVKSCDSMGKVKDLSVSSNYIVGPMSANNPNRERIGKSKISESLWLPDTVCA